ncbi:MAG: transposase [Planctomycetaceae bacterium]|nr:transposase [Planctomycetaceae bacterium]
MYNTPLAYFITFTCYGTWLHGDERGSVDDEHNKYGHEFVAFDMNRLGQSSVNMKGDALTLDAKQRRLITDAIQNVCEYRQWKLLKVSVRTNHVHVVVSADIKPENVMLDFKRYATRRLVDANEIPSGTKLWTRHGSTRYLWNEDSVANACRYVEEQ